jgi:signal transduction histidine kinase
MSWTMDRARSRRELAPCIDSGSAARASDAVALERARIARELHDVVAHAVTVMLLHAAGARRMLASAPVQAAQALTRVDEQGRQAMHELRRMLLMLRTEPDGLDAAPASRQPDVADIGRLVEGMRRAGVPVRLHLHGEPSGLPPGVGLVAYRVVQEALTNVSRHATPGTAATVRLVWARELRIEVANDVDRPLPSAGGIPSGHGLLGLRERVWLAGGRIEAGPVPGGRFRLTATLPVADEDLADEDLSGAGEGG